MALQVEKRDGRLEDFDRSKIVASVVHAGGSPAEAEGVATQIEAWLQARTTQGPVKSSDLKIRVLDLLRPVNEEAAQSYETYKKET